LPFRLALLDITSDDIDALGGEAVFCGDKAVGSLTSVAYGHHVGRQLGFAYLRKDRLRADTGLEVSIFGKRYPAAILDAAPYDPCNARLKG